MSSILGTIDAWWTRHPHAAELILFAGATFISLFTGIVRQALFIPVRYSAVGLLRLIESFIPAQRNIPPALLLSLLFFGGFAARLLNLYGLLGNFLNRDKAVKQLEDIVAGRPLSQTTRRRNAGQSRLKVGIAVRVQ